MGMQEYETSNEGKQPIVCNASFHPIDGIFTYSNLQQKGQILYVGYGTSNNTQPVSETLRLVAFNLNNKQVIWQRTVHTMGAIRLRVNNSIVYLLCNRVGTPSMLLAALDAGTGQERWQYACTGTPSMVICNGIVFLHSTELQALDGRTGKVLWHYDFRHMGDRLGSSLSITTDAVFFTGYSWDSQEDETFVRSLHLTSGAVRWNTSLGLTAPLSPHSENVLVDGYILYTVKRSRHLESDEVVALHVQDGTLLWRSNKAVYEKPLMVEKNVLFVSGGEILTAFNASTGELLWTQRIEGWSYFYALPDHRLYVNMPGVSLSALDNMTGKMIWFSQRGCSRSDGAYIVVDSTNIYMIERDLKEIAILNRTTGNKQQFLQIGEHEAERLRVIAVE